jgi:hypothetical protein
MKAALGGYQAPRYEGISSALKLARRLSKENILRPQEPIPMQRA